MIRHHAARPKKEGLTNTMRTAADQASGPECFRDPQRAAGVSDADRHRGIDKWLGQLGVAESTSSKARVMARRHRFSQCCLSRHSGVFCTSSRHAVVGQMPLSSFEGRHETRESWHVLPWSGELMRPIWVGRLCPYRRTLGRCLRLWHSRETEKRATLQDHRSTRSTD